MGPRTICNWSAVASFAISAILLQLLSRPAIDANPVIQLHWVADDAIYGCAYDPDDPSQKVDVYAYRDGFSSDVTMARAQYGCPWNPNLNGYGFWIQYRWPANYWYDTAVVALNAPGTPGTYSVALGSQAPGANFFDRLQNTLVFANGNYGIGISRRYGAIATEFYNRRVDGTMDLITTNVGAALQTALFGDPNIPVGSYPACAGDLRYNPTQSGNACLQPDLTLPNSTADMCQSSIVGACTAHYVTDTTPLVQGATSRWIQWRVHFRNYYYPTAAGPWFAYQPYDDVYALVTYTFHDTHVEIDHLLWKTTTTTWGTSPFQQLPVAFLSQMNTFTFDGPSGITSVQRSNANSHVYQLVAQFDVTPSVGRWIAGESISVPQPGIPVMTPGNHLTLAFYTPESFLTQCPDRKFQMEFLPNDEGVQHASAVQNVWTDVEILPGQYYSAKTLVFPFRYDDTLPDAHGTIPLWQRLDTFVSQGGPGFMPGDECNT